MGGSLGFGKSRSSSRPRDMTPQEFVGLRGPLAAEIAAIMRGGVDQAPASLINPAPIRGAETEALAQLDAQSQPSDAFRRAIATLTGQAEGESNPFATAAGLTPAEMFGLQQIAQQAFGGSATSGDQTALLQSIMRGEGLSPDSNPFLQATIDAATRPIIEQFGDMTNQQRGRFTQAGQFIAPGASSPFELAQARLTTGVANAIGDTSSDIAFRNFDAERNRQLQAVGLAQQGDELGFTQALRGTEALGLPREIQDTALQRRSEAFESEQDRAAEAARAIPGIERSAIENTLSNLQAQALPRLIEELGIERGLSEFQRQQNQLLAVLQIAGQLGSPTLGQRSRSSAFQFDIAGSATGGAGA